MINLERIVEKILIKRQIKHGRINKDLSVSFDHDVHMSERNLEILPFKIREITRGHSLDISNNHLISLEGCPEKVFNFYCYRNKLSYLEGGPLEVNYYNASYNYLLSLEGGPTKVSNFDVSYNKLRTFYGAPREIKQNFKCYSNCLTNLQHFPEVHGRVNLEGNPIWTVAKLFIDDPERSKIIELFNFSDVIIDDRLYKVRLEYVLGQFDIRMGKDDYKLISNFYKIV